MEPDSVELKFLMMELLEFRMAELSSEGTRISRPWMMELNFVETKFWMVRLGSVDVNENHEARTLWTIAECN